MSKKVKTWQAIPSGKHTKRKNAQDAKRGKIFMKLAKEIYVATKEGGADPEANSALRLVIEKQKAPICRMKI